MLLHSLETLDMYHDLLDLLKATVSFSVDLGQNDTRIVTMKAGQVALGRQESGQYIFSIADDFVAAVNDDNQAEFANVNIYEGVYLTKSFTVDYSQKIRDLFFQIRILTRLLFV